MGSAVVRSRSPRLRIQSSLTQSAPDLQQSAIRFEQTMHNKAQFSVRAHSHLESYKACVLGLPEVGMLSDQGVERGLADIPNTDDSQKIQELLADTASGKKTMLAAEPETFFWPRLLSVTGPLHIIWNAFARVVQISPEWDGYLNMLKGCLHLLGSAPIRRRFLALTPLSPDYRRLIKGFKHKVVDWKWEYMAQVFVHGLSL